MMLNKLRAQKYPSVVSVVLTALLFGVLAWGGVVLTRDESRVAAVWLPNAVLVAILLRGRGLGDLAFLPAAFAANIVANVYAGDEFARAISLSLVNSLEVLVVWFGMWRLNLRRPDMSRLPDLLSFCAVAGIVAPVASGLSALAILGAPDAASAWSMFHGWAVADGLGLLLVTPTILIFADAWKTRRRPTRHEVAEWLTLFTAGTAVSISVFSQTTYPFLFAVIPVVVLHAFWQGSVGTALSVVKISIIASIATAFDDGPIHLVKGSLGDQLFALQAFLATCFAVGLPVAAMLKSRDLISDELRERRDFADFILQNVGDVIFRTDAAGRWTFLNAEWEKLTGFTVDQSLGWPTTKLLTPVDVAKASALYPRIINGEIKECVLDQQFIDAKGILHHIEVTVQPFVDDEGAFAGTVGNIRDVSERVRQQSALAESEERFRRMAETAPIGIFRAGPDGQVTYVNKLWSDKVGFTVDEMLGDGWMRALADTAQYKDDPAWQGFNKPGDIKRRIGQFRGADGGDLWIETVTSAEFDSAGKIVGFIGAANDITEERRVSEQLREHQAQLSLLANNATDGVFRLGLDGRCKYASPSSRTLLGISPRALIGANLLDRFHPDDQQIVRETFADLVNANVERPRVAFRSELLSAPGIFVWLEATCGLVRDEITGAPYEIIASIRNIDETKALEAELREARERAERAATAKSAFLANMSHEIRTPMSGVIGFTELLLNSELNNSQRNQAEMIAESGHAMMRLLNDILDISKIEAGQMQVVCEPVDLRHKLQGAVRLMQPIADSKKIELSILVEDDVPQWINGDQLRLRQIVLNLVGNAVKFTERGWIKLHALVDRSSPEPRLQIDVSDSGIGIPADRLDVIFEQFTQADGSTARKYGGTGLGLSISDQLARMMGGEINVSSIVGEGTMFSVSLPLVRSDAPSVECIGRPIKLKGRGGASRPRVLIAEDHDINQALILAMAERVGVDAEIAVDGLEVIKMVHSAAVAQNPYRLVLMDIQMPNIDGLEAARRLRAAGFSADDLPIVALTANAYAEDVAACLDAGMQAHLAKPVQMVDLQNIVAAYVDQLPPSPRETNLEVTHSRDTIQPTLMERYQLRKMEALALWEKQIDNPSPSETDISELITQLHKLAGTAGYFGDAEFGEAALTMEETLRGADTDKFRKLICDNARLFEQLV